MSSIGHEFGFDEEEGRRLFQLSQDVLEGLEQNPEWVAAREADRKQHEYEQWFRDAGDEQVIERVYSSYHDAREGLAAQVDSMGIDERARWLGQLDEDAPKVPDWTEQQFKRSMGDYPRVSSEALKRFHGYGMRSGDFTQSLAMVTTLRDPALATWLLGKLRQTPGYREDEDHIVMAREFAEIDRSFGVEPPDWVLEARPVQEATSEHLGRAHVAKLRHRLMNSRNLIQVIGVVAAMQRPNRHIKRLAQEILYRPLEEIADLPPLHLQILESILQNSPTDGATPEII